jgi:TonB family protein
MTTGPIGNFAFESLVPGDYTLTIRQPGFQIFVQPNIHLLPNQNVTLPGIRLSLGNVSAQITVKARRTGAAPPQLDSTCTAATTQAAPPAAPASGPTRVRIGGNVEMAALACQVLPRYPDAARQAGIEGTVSIRAVIGKDGSLLSAEVINADQVDSSLAKSASDALSQWRFMPATLNGQPVEVLTQIDIQFSLSN